MRSRGLNACRIVKAPPWSGPGVSVVELSRIASFREVEDWFDVWLAQRREAEARYGKVIIDEGFAKTAFPNIPREQALALVQWWANRLAAAAPSATGSVPLGIDLQDFANNWDGLKVTPTWANTEIKMTWDTTQLAMTWLKVSAVVDAAARENTWLRAFTESVKDIIDPNAPDPFGIGRFLRGAKTVLIVGAVVVGGLLVLRAVEAVRPRSS